MKDSKGSPLATGDQVTSPQVSEIHFIEVDDGVCKILPNLPRGEVYRLDETIMSNSFWIKVDGKS